MTAVERLARFVVDRSWEDLSETARLELKIRVLDSLGCALGALDGPPVQAIRAQLDHFGGRPLCKLVGGGATAPDHAAFRLKAQGAVRRSGASSRARVGRHRL